MKNNPFKLLNKFDIALWSVSATAIILSFVLCARRDYLTLVAALVGISALLFNAKGHVLGPTLIVVFAVFYGIISYSLAYYGEMITYLGMSAPSAIACIISWLKHPHNNGAQVEVATIKLRAVLTVLLIDCAVTTAFYFILRALGTANLVVSTVSVATSFFAVSLSVLRSPLYAVGYAVNDVVLVVLWSFAVATDISSLPMVICFSIFLVNDTYTFISWNRMKRRQAADGEPTIAVSEISRPTANN